MLNHYIKNRSIFQLIDFKINIRNGSKNDGFNNLKQSILDLLDEVPKELGKSTTEPVIHEIQALISQEDWLKSGDVRCRDEGHIFFCDVFIVPKKNEVSLREIEKLHDKIKKLN